MTFRASIQVRFQDVDAGGVLFFGRIFDYLHMAYEEWIASSGVDRVHYFAGEEYLVPIAHAEADYRSPIRHGERVEVSIDVARVGRASFHLRYRVAGPGGDLRVEASTIHAFVDRGTMKPIPIPHALRAFFLGHLALHPVADQPPK
jgi:YbgC/YbaW family acyl-CoA thioester hydrolase